MKTRFDFLLNSQDTILHWAAANGDVEAVELLIEQGKDPCFISTPPAGSALSYERTPLCWAALHGHVKVVAKMLDYPSVREDEDPAWLDALDSFLEQKPPRKEINMMIDPISGNTPLHDKIRNANSSDEIFQYLSDVGYEAFMQMSKTCNYAGVLPIHILHKEADRIPLGKDLLQRDYVTALLMLFISKHVIKDLSVKMNLNEICKTNNIEEAIDPYRYLLFNLACAAVNYSRDVIKASKTHTETNLLSCKESIKLAEKITSLRKKTDKQEFDEEIFTIKSEHVGNCIEFSYLIFDYLKKEIIRNNYNISVQVCGIENSDHTVVIAGRHLNPLKIDPSRIIIDGWSGKISLYKDLDRELQCFRSYDASGFYKVNTTSFFNPRYHDISPTSISNLTYKGGRQEKSVATDPEPGSSGKRCNP